MPSSVIEETTRHAKKNETNNTTSLHHRHLADTRFGCKNRELKNSNQVVHYSPFARRALSARQEPTN